MGNLSGTTLGNYKILHLLGAGGMGEIYLAQDTRLNRKVAIKFLPTELTQNEQAKKRLLKEAQAAAKLDHPNICAIYEAGEEKDRSFIAMQYIEGETLAARIQRKHLDLRESLEIATQIADALAEAHSHGIIHRDIKPQNIMLTSRGQAKVMDFGLASAIEDGNALESMKALQIDDTLSEAHASLGVTYTWLDYDWTAADKEYKRALELNPNNAVAHQWYGFYLMMLGKADESIAEAKRSIELDPLSAEANSCLGVAYFEAQRYDAALQQLRTTIELEPDYWFAHLYHARVLQKKGRLSESIDELEKARRMQGAAAEVTSALGYAYAAAGRKDDAKKIIAELQEQSKQIYIAPYLFVTIYAALGEKDLAFEYLEKEYKEGAYYLNYLKLDPEIDNLRGDPRFAQYLRRLKLE